MRKKTFKENFNNFLSENMIAILIIVPLILLLSFLFIPITATGTINSFGWCNSIAVEELTTVHESGWNPPAGANITHSYRKKKSTDEDGKDVYATYYEYDIDRYNVVDYVVTSGEDREPYWGKVVLKAKQREGIHEANYYTYIQTNHGIEQYKMKKVDWKKAEIGGKVKFLRFRFSKHILKTYVV